MVKWISLLAMNDMTLMLILFNLGFCSQQIARFLQHDKLSGSEVMLKSLSWNGSENKDDMHTF